MTQETNQDNSAELLAAVVRKERDIICEAIGERLTDLRKEKEAIEDKMHRLWDARAEILRDIDRQRDQKRK